MRYELAKQGIRVNVLVYDRLCADRGRRIVGDEQEHEIFLTTHTPSFESPFSPDFLSNASISSVFLLTMC